MDNTDITNALRLLKTNCKHQQKCCDCPCYIYSANDEKCHCIFSNPTPYEWEIED